MTDDGQLHTIDTIGIGSKIVQCSYLMLSSCTSISLYNIIEIYNLLSLCLETGMYVKYISQTIGLSSRNGPGAQ